VRVRSHGYGEEFATQSRRENVALAPNDFIHRLIAEDQIVEGSADLPSNQP
jgi:hypothetical protein